MRTAGNKMARDLLWFGDGGILLTQRIKAPKTGTKSEKQPVSVNQKRLD